MNEMYPAPYVPSISDDFDVIAVTVGRALTPDEVSRVGGCLGYALRQTLAGEDLGDVESVTVQAGQTTLSYLFDSTKSQRDDPDYEGALRLAAQYIVEGTPVRKTNRAGAGTMGTRLVEGIGPVALTFTVDPDTDPTPPAAPALPADVTELLAARQALQAAQRRYAEAAVRFAGVGL